MPHRFVVMIDGELQEFDCYQDIPERIDHVIEFLPEIPPPPHSEAQHQEIDQWHDLFLELMRREHASSSQSRRS
jgi:beta-galactosidase beta subunit